MELPSSFSGSSRFDLFHFDYQEVFPQHQAEQKCCEPHEQRFKARSRPLSSENTGRERYQFRRLLCSLVKWYSYVGLLQNSLIKDIIQNPEPFSELLWLKKVPGFCFVLFFRIATTRTRKKQPPESFESAVDFEISHVVGRGRTRTLFPERDFKSLVSASLRQIQFSFVVSFDFSLRERFFLRERGGFALF